MHVMSMNEELSKSARLGRLMGGGLLALTAACSGDMGENSFATELERDGHVSDLENVVPVDAEANPGASIDKARFVITATYDGFPVGCDGSRIQIIRPAQSRAEDILDATIASTQAAWEELLFSAPPYSTLTERFRFLFNANSSDPYYFVITAARMDEKLRNIRAVIGDAYHTCHGDDESVAFIGGDYVTCGESLVNASTNFVGGADNAIRWCDIGLAQSQSEVAVTMVHELAHQDRTADASGTRVIDTNANGPAYNAHNIARWLRDHF